MAASCADRLLASLNPPNGSSFFTSSLRLRMLLIEKLVNVELVLPESDVFDSVLAGLTLDRLDECRCVVGVRGRWIECCGDGSGLDTTSISSSM